MASFNFLERIIWLHARIQSGRYPNADDLAREFDLSSRTAQRTIAHYRDRLRAPIAYHRKRKGYYYSRQDYQFPLGQVSQEELLIILLAQSLLDKSAGGYISRFILQFSRKFLSPDSPVGLSREKLEERFSAAWNLYAPARADTFHLVIRALLENNILSLNYTSPVTGSTTHRRAEPHHLQHYMGSWVLIAFCLEKQDWRKFYLSRMDQVKILPERFEPRPISQWSYQVESSFGIFQGETSTAVLLRFSPFRARWIREQVWHPDQKVRELEDGSLELEIPVADFREIKLKILSFGADVEVIRPESLRREVAAEIQKMKKIYQK